MRLLLDTDPALHLTEVVLAVLLSRFKIEVSPNKDVKWNIAGVVYPTVGSDATPSLPLKLSRV